MTTHKRVNIEDFFNSLPQSDREYLASSGLGKTTGSDFQKFVDENPAEVRPTIEQVFDKGLSRYVIDKFKKETAKFCKRMFIRKSGNKTCQLHSKVLRKQFGNNDNGFKLRDLLLIVVDKGYIAGGFNGRDPECKKYRLDMNNFNRLCLLSGITLQSVKEEIEKDIRTEYFDELSSGVFKHKSIDGDFRQYHPLQAEPSEERNKVLYEFGFMGEIDISNCAPSMLYNYASHLNPAYTKYKTELINYMTDTTTWRVDVANEVKSTYLALTDKPDTDIDFEAVVKSVINKRLHGATLFIDINNSIWTETCDQDQHLFYSIKNNVKLTKVLDQIINCVDLSKKDFKEKHRYLFDTSIVVGSDDDNVKSRLAKEQKETRVAKNKRGRTTYLMYTHYEAQVREFIIHYLEEQGIRYFNLHDGLFVTKQVDISILEEQIKEKLKIDVKLKMKM